MTATKMLCLAALVLMAMPGGAFAQPAKTQPPKTQPPKAQPPKAQPTKAPSAKTEPATGFVAEAANFPGGVAALGNLTYLTLPGFRPLTLDLYRPAHKKDAAPLPAILYLHAGGWSAGDARTSRAFADLPGILAAVAAHGYAVASVNYRLSGEARFPAPLQDVKSAIRWLRFHGSDYGIDTTRIMVWGEGAGGQLAALAGTSCGVSTFEPIADAGQKNLPSDCVQGVIDWYGPSDLAALDSDAGSTPPVDPHTKLGAYLGCEPEDCEAGVVHAASPLSYIGDMSPPFLIEQGADDAVVSPKQAQELYDTLHGAGVPVEQALYPGAGHDFAPADSDTGKLALARLLDFVSRTFPPTPAKPETVAQPPAKAAPAKAAPAKTPARPQAVKPPAAKTPTGKPPAAKPPAAKPKPAKQ